MTTLTMFNFSLYYLGGKSLKQHVNNINIINIESLGNNQNIWKERRDVLLNRKRHLKYKFDPQFGKNQTTSHLFLNRPFIWSIHNIFSLVCLKLYVTKGQEWKF